MDMEDARRHTVYRRMRMAVSVVGWRRRTMEAEAVLMVGTRQRGGEGKVGEIWELLGRNFLVGGRRQRLG
ncbi:hypothetical protein GUJ93_ZPchr0014g47389 [Zizania palustris]|uniref:Uncharacterized protein n=1 Tax=Zizania palustris TaxID=103762 RepID=A0A8J5TA73_ZIZPA|nr:hypothetical protein GUJ93_ZPchr0014g47389 [Zizania palustris]